MELLQIGIPLSGEQITLFRVAFLAAGDTITFSAPPAAYQRDKVIQGELFGCHLPITVVAAPFGDAVLPPLTFTQLARALALFTQLLFRNVGKNVHGVDDGTAKGQNTRRSISPLEFMLDFLPASA